jgi:WD40 repeat protein
MLRELALGQTVEKWVTVSLVDDSWATEATAETRARRLVLNPGKHKVRIGYDFSPSEGGMVPASPVSGPVEIEILPEKAVDHASDWGDPSKGVSARIRAAKPKFGFGEPVTLELDVKAAGDGGRELAVWTAARNSSPARLEVGGVWYKRVPVEVAKVPAPTLTAGEQVDGWATLNLSDQWVVEYYTGLPPGQAGQRLILSPGKYTFRVGFSFSNPTSSAVPVSGKLEIEVLPPVPAGKVAQFRDGGWRSKAAWSPHGPSGVRNLAVAPGDKYLYTVGNDGLVLWDMTGPKPAAEQTVRYTTDGLQFAGLDRDGLPLLFRQKVRPQPAEATTDLTVLRLPDMGENAKPQLAVPTDTVRAWAVRPDGKALALGFGWWDSVRLVDVGTGKDRTLEAPARPKDQLAFLHRLLFSRDGKTLIGLGSNEYPVTGKMNGLVVRWDAETGRVRWKSQESEGQPVGALTADGKTLVTGWRLGKVFTVWDLATGTKLREIPTNGAEGIGVSADGKTVAIGTHTEEIARQPVLEIWDLAGKTVGQRVPVPAAVRSISFRDDGRAFATADINGEVRWWVREK